MSRLVWVGKKALMALVLLVVAGALGGFLAGIVDVVAPMLVAGTLLGPHHPQTAAAWTVVALALELGVGKWAGWV